MRNLEGTCESNCIGRCNADASTTSEVMTMSEDQQQKACLLVALHEQRHHQRNPLDLTDAARARRIRLEQVKSEISESHVQTILTCISC